MRSVWGVAIQATTLGSGAPDGGDALAVTHFPRLDTAVVHEGQHI